LASSAAGASSGTRLTVDAPHFSVGLIQTLAKGVLPEATFLQVRRRIFAMAAAPIAPQREGPGEVVAGA
jgi:hypothetical protein